MVWKHQDMGSLNLSLLFVQRNLFLNLCLREWWGLLRSEEGWRTEVGGGEGEVELSLSSRIFSFRFNCSAPDEISTDTTNQLFSPHTPSNLKLAFLSYPNIFTSQNNGPEVSVLLRSTISPLQPSAERMPSLKILLWKSLQKYRPVYKPGKCKKQQHIF